MVENSVDDFRYAVTFRLWSEILHQENHTEGPDDRDKNHKWPPGACWCMRVRVVCCGEPAKKEKIVKDRNESSECHGSQTCHDPYQQRERPQDCWPDRSRRRCCAVSSQNNLPKYRLDGSNTVLSSCISPECNIRLDDVRFEQTATTAIVVAVYRTPSPFTPEEVASLEPRLPMPQGASNVELRIRSVPVTVASKHGYVESPEGLDSQRPE